MPKRKLKLTPQDKEFAKAVKERDGYKCVICGSTVRPNAHHLIVREQPSTKYDIKNGLTLCPKHHFFCRTISAHNNPMGLFTWLADNRPEQLEYVYRKMREILQNED